MLQAIILCLVYLPLAYAMRIAAILLAPVAVLTLDDDGRPWSVFWWMETHDNLGWSGPLSEKDTRTVFEEKGPRAGMRAWWWRNIAYAGQYYAFSIPFLTEDVKVQRVTSRGWPRPARGPWLQVVTATIGGRKYFEVNTGFAFPTFLLYARIGWKLLPLAEGQPAYGSTGMYTGITPRTDGNR